jgi:adenosylcobinamide-phosphate synthase
MMFPPDLALLTDQALVLITALLLDITLGDPREGTRLERVHPVVLMGRVIGAIDRSTPRGNSRLEVVLGILMVPAVAAIFASPALLLYPLREGSRLAYVAAASLLLKGTFTIEGLRRYGLETLGHPVQEKRRRVARIVGRTTEGLSDEELNSAAIESTAEGLTDSFVSPLIFYALLGIPGALLYRAVNTMDSMVGYRTPPYLHFGRAAAATDRAMNYLPERLGAALLSLACGLRGSHRGRGPWPATIGAMAFLLGVRLRKRGGYDINPGGREPSEEDVKRSVGTTTRAAALFLPIVLLVLILASLGGWSWWNREVLSLT